MAGIDYNEGKSPNSSFRLDKGGVLGHPGPFKAEVMSTVDPTRSGRIRVWIQSFGDENTKHDETTWFTVRYMSPFYGVTPHKMLDEAPDPNFEANGHAYGMWATVPDVGVEVLVVFVEGDPTQGYYIGFVPEPQMNHMIPGIGAQANPHYSNDAQKEKCAHAPQVPVIEMDKKTESMHDAEFSDIPKPMHSVMAGQMWKQGIITDTIRGPITSSAQRESPSYVFGLNTPGRPIYGAGMFDHEVKGLVESGAETDTSIVGRRGGHSFVLDDGDIDGNNNLVRIRTSSGHQITMSDDGKSIYVIHANGLTWAELGAEGTIDVYAANSINMRTGGDFNIHADKNVNINALENINMYAKKNIIAEAEINMELTGKKAFTAYSKTIVGVKSDGTLHTDAAGEASFKSGGTTEVKASNVGLNHGFPARSVTAPKPIPQINHPDAVIDNTEGWKLEQAKYKSIVSRSPSHEPWDAHNTGIKNVKQPGK